MYDDRDVPKIIFHEILSPQEYSLCGKMDAQGPIKALQTNNTAI
jgi:hypothetical protein